MQEIHIHPTATRSEARLGPSSEDLMRLSNIQVLRALAATLVVFHHMGEAVRIAGISSWFNTFLGLQRLGAAGVDLFFVISGFIMIHVAGKQFGTRRAGLDFLRKRFLRIYPLYWIVTALAIVGWSTGKVFRNLDVTPAFLVGSFLCLPMSRHPIVDQGWSLSFELYFYLVFAFSLPVFRTKRAFLAGSLGFFSASVAIGMIFPTTNLTLLAFLTHPLLLEFWMGMLVAFLWDAYHDHPQARRLAPILLSLGAAALAVSALYVVPWRLRIIAWGIPSALLLAGASLLPQSKSSVMRIWAAVGDSSYSLYLTHGFVAILLGGTLKAIGGTSLSGDILIVAGALTSLFLGHTFWVFVERPTQSLSNALLSSAMVGGKRPTESQA